MFNKKLFKEKLEHSIDLLQKAEKLALMYDKQDGFYLAFSGGKDSQALYHVAKMAGVKFKGHMSLTSVDPPQVIRFVKKQYPDVELIKPKMSMFDKAIEMGILPTMRVRWCCAQFKESAGAGKVTLIGVRAAESARRAKRNEVEVKSRKFSGDLEGFDAWSQAEIEKKMAKAKRKLNEDEFSLNTDNEVRCINGKDSILISPIFKWTEYDVWYFLNEIVKVPHCELYDMGYTRIGCILCPMSSMKSKLRGMKMFPHVKRGWIKAIKAIREGGVFYTDMIWIIPPPEQLPKGDLGREVQSQVPQRRGGSAAYQGQSESFGETRSLPYGNIFKSSRGQNLGADAASRSSTAATDGYYGTNNPRYVITGRTLVNFSIAPLNK